MFLGIRKQLFLFIVINESNNMLLDDLVDKLCS